MASLHVHIHREFADQFLSMLPVAGDPLDDYSLHTTLEIAIDSEGALQRLGVVETSGLQVFDFAAFSAVVRAAPFPRPPQLLLSSDGLVYLHWGFYRNERACGAFNATLYRLKQVPPPIEQPPASELGNATLSVLPPNPF